MMIHISTVTLEDIQALIASGDDRHFNQIRCKKNGEIYLSQDIVGAENISDLAFRFETFDAENDYVGIAAADDDSWVQRVFNAIIDWRENGSGGTYLDGY